MPPSGNTARVLLNFKLWLLPRLYRLGEEPAGILAGIIDPNYQKELGLQVHDGVREEGLGNQMMHWTSFGAEKRQVKQPQLENCMITRDEGLDHLSRAVV